MVSSSLPRSSYCECPLEVQEGVVRATSSLLFSPLSGKSWRVGTDPCATIWSALSSHFPLKCCGDLPVIFSIVAKLFNSVQYLICCRVISQHCIRAAIWQSFTAVTFVLSDQTLVRAGELSLSCAAKNGTLYKDVLCPFVSFTCLKREPCLMATACIAANCNIITIPQTAATRRKLLYWPLSNNDPYKGLASMLPADAPISIRNTAVEVTTI